MHKYQIIEARLNEFNAFSKAPRDICEVASSVGFNAIRFWTIGGKSLFSRMARKFIAVIQCVLLFWRVKNKAMILVQVPCFTLNDALTFKVFSYVKRLRQVTLISVIHDIDEFRFGQGVANRGKCGLSRLAQLADFLVVHNKQMASWYMSLGVEKYKIVSLDIFDYLTTIPDLSYELDGASPSVIIAGTLNPEVAGFVKYLKFYTSIQWELYGPEYNAEITAAVNVKYNGCFPADDLPARLKGKFGLIWYGDSTKSCSGYLRDYLRIINPHKMSLYLASGIPIIVWSKSAAAIFVKENNVGICIDSLDGLENAIGRVSRDQYLTMRGRAKEIGDRLREGYYTRKALKKCFMD